MLQNGNTLQCTKRKTIKVCCYCLCLISNITFPTISWQRNESLSLFYFVNFFQLNHISVPQTHFPSQYSYILCALPIFYTLMRAGIKICFSTSSVNQLNKYRHVTLIYSALCRLCARATSVCVTAAWAQYCRLSKLVLLCTVVFVGAGTVCSHI